MARRRLRHPDRSSGFSLPEVLVALAVFALASIVLAASYLNILNAYARAAKGSEEDPYLAQARRELLTQTDLAAAESGDEFDTPEALVNGSPPTPSEHVKWTAVIEPTTTTDLFTVTFTCVISPSGASGGKTDTETFMLLRPTWSQATDRATLRQKNAAQIAVLQGKQQS